jgi:hypothetical protein
MANPVITNNDLGSSILEAGEFRDELLTFAGADTYVGGTILARDSVSGNLIAYVQGGVTNEDGIPKAILTYDVVATGAGDIAIRAGISGKYRKERLVIDADGDASNVTDVVIDELRDYGLVAIDVSELNIQDNQ